MRILFYLPVIVPRWFERLFVPLIEKLASEHEVHILAPAPWHGTGLGERELALCSHLPQVTYHIVNDADHPSMRTQPVQQQAIVDFVNVLAPDYTLCRSADFETIKAFPGIVRQITEGGAEPLQLPLDTFHLTEHPFDHGIMPDLTSEHVEALDKLIAPHWERLLASGMGDEAQDGALTKWANLPEDRPTVFVPLEYEDEENFFTQHRLGARPNARLVEELAELWGDRVFFAFTNHPLNIARIDNTAIEEMVRSYGDCARLYPDKTPLGTKTSVLLTRQAQAMLVGDSKMFALAAAYRTPLIRHSRFQTGNWLNPISGIESFLQSFAGGTLAGPEPRQARTWLSFHVANNLINLADPNLTATDFIARLENPIDPARWERNFEFYSKEW